jgi:OOP family OmpA-OmpF porin
MTRKLLTAFIVLVLGALLMGCGAKKQQQTSGAGAPQMSAEGEALPASDAPPAEDAMVTGVSAEGPPLDEYMEIVDNFLVILDASGSKYLPYNGQIKLKIAKDIARRFNQRVPDRPLTGALRRYGFEAGAFSEKTELLFGVGPYSRPAYGDAIEKVRWAGGKSPLALAIDAANEDLSTVTGLMALVIISDGKIYRGDPVAAAQRMKDRYGDRLCIYTAQVGDLPFGRKLLQRIAEVGGCGYYVTSDDLVPDANMDQWVDDIFNRRRDFRPGPRYVERAAGPCPDADGDGVCDDQDACPDTPRGAKVDARGCWDIGKVQFVIDRYNVRPQYYPIIDEVVRVMKLNPGLKIKVQGHTCTIASEKYNMKLSYNRAISVSDYMLKQGINSNRISVEGFGFHRPTATNQTEEGRELNRRVEFEPVK